jgi:hypothetical protein
MSEFKSRIVFPEQYDATGFTNENSLARALMSKPDQLTPVITMLLGGWNNRFPLSALTEGQAKGTKGIATDSINNVEYDYPVMGKRKTTEKVDGSPYGTSDKPGLYNSKFFVTFRTKWFTRQQTLRSPNGTQARVMNDPKPVQGGYQYELQLYNPSPGAYCDPSQLTKGTVWGAVGGATVGESLSVGNYSNVQTPGKRKNQISILRKSYHLAGNIAKKIVEFQLFDANGKPSNLWLDFEEYQHMLSWKEECELHLWTSEYNRDEFGNIPLIDTDTGQPIPTGAGLFQQIPNSDTYTVLTENKIKTIVGDVFRGSPDTQNMEVILYTGEGGFEEFDNAMKNSSLFSRIVEGAHMHFMRNVGGNLQLGGYFKSYVTVDGHTITLKRLPFLDESAYADSSYRHPINGRPLSSYEMYFVDMSTYDGQPNVRMVHQNGRLEIRGIEQGMTLLKGSSYGDYKGNYSMQSPYLNLANQQDKTSLHFLGTKGIEMMRNTHSFKLLPNINYWG